MKEPVVLSELNWALSFSDILGNNIVEHFKTSWKHVVKQKKEHSSSYQI